MSRQGEETATSSTISQESRNLPIIKRRQETPESEGDEGGEDQLRARATKTRRRQTSTPSISDAVTLLDGLRSTVANVSATLAYLQHHLEGLNEVQSKNVDREVEPRSSAVVSRSKTPQVIQLHHRNEEPAQGAEGLVEWSREERQHLPEETRKRKGETKRSSRQCNEVQQESLPSEEEIDDQSQKQCKTECNKEDLRSSLAEAGCNDRRQSIHAPPPSSTSVPPESGFDERFSSLAYTMQDLQRSWEKDFLDGGILAQRLRHIDPNALEKVGARRFSDYIIAAQRSLDIELLYIKDRVNLYVGLRDVNHPWLKHRRGPFPSLPLQRKEILKRMGVSSLPRTSPPSQEVEKQKHLMNKKDSESKNAQKKKSKKSRKGKASQEK